VGVTEMRYLGVYFVQSRYLKCSLTVAKRGFYRAANSIFGKIGRCASEEVILQFISSKCIPIFSQPSIYIDGWLYGMSMTSVVCNVSVLSQNDSTYYHSVFTT